MSSKSSRRNRKSSGKRSTPKAETNNSRERSERYVLSSNPYPISILAVDVGKASGVAEFAPDGKLVFSTEWQLDQDMLTVADYVTAWAEDAEARDEWPMLVLENAMWGRQVTGPAMGVWKYAGLSAGLLPKQIVGLHVSTWRRLLYGTGKLSTEEAKEKALSTVRDMYDRDDRTHNTAEAILMGYVAQRLNTVWERVPKKVVKRLLENETCSNI